MAEFDLYTLYIQYIQCSLVAVAVAVLFTVWSKRMIIFHIFAVVLLLLFYYIEPFFYEKSRFFNVVHVLVKLKKCSKITNEDEFRHFFSFSLQCHHGLPQVMHRSSMTLPFYFLLSFNAKRVYAIIIYLSTLNVSNFSQVFGRLSTANETTNGNRNNPVVFESGMWHTRNNTHFVCVEFKIWIIYIMIDKCRITVARESIHRKRIIICWYEIWPKCPSAISRNIDC